MGHIRSEPSAKDQLYSHESLTNVFINVKEISHFTTRERLVNYCVRFYADTQCRDHTNKINMNKHITEYIDNVAFINRRIIPRFQSKLSLRRELYIENSFTCTNSDPRRNTYENIHLPRERIACGTKQMRRHRFHNSGEDSIKRQTGKRHTATCYCNWVELRFFIKTML